MYKQRDIYLLFMYCVIALLYEQTTMCKQFLAYLTVSVDQHNSICC